MCLNHTQTGRGRRVSGAFIAGSLLLLSWVGHSVAQDKVPTLDDATEKLLEAVENDFDDSLKDLGELAGEVFVCLKDSKDDEQHKDRVKVVYQELNKLFGTDRAFIFAASFGYGAASENDAATCTELSDEFEDRYGAIIEKYELVD